MANPISRIESLSPIETDHFLPPVSRWAAVGSWFIVLVLGSAITASFFVKYRTTVRAPAILRPTGELVLLQSAVTGRVAKIMARDNMPVRSGDMIAQLETTSLAAQATQLSANLKQGESKLMQLDAQMTAVDQELAAELALAQRSEAVAAADYRQISQDRQNQRIAAEAAVQEAQIQLKLATQEAESFRQLVSSGAVSRLQLVEKESALASALARVISLQTKLNPAEGSVQAAKERIAQAQASGAATVARLQQSKQQLTRQRLEIQEQIEAIRQEVAQVKLGLENAVVRSPSAGILHEFSLRNPGQVVNSGEVIAKVIPTDVPIVVRAMVPSQQINKIEVDQLAQLKVYACPFSEFGTVKGKVKEISPDVVTLSPANNSSAGSLLSSAQSASFYSVVIETNVPALISKSKKTCVLSPGMEGQATILSSEETVMAFLRRKAGLAVGL